MLKKLISSGLALSVILASNMLQANGEQQYFKAVLDSEELSSLLNPPNTFSSTMLNGIKLVERRRCVGCYKFEVEILSNYLLTRADLEHFDVTHASLATRLNLETNEIEVYTEPTRMPPYDR